MGRTARASNAPPRRARPGRARPRRRHEHDRDRRAVLRPHAGAAGQHGGLDLVVRDRGSRGRCPPHGRGHVARRRPRPSTTPSGTVPACVATAMPSCRSTSAWCNRPSISPGVRTSCTRSRPRRAHRQLRHHAHPPHLGVDRRDVPDHAAREGPVRTQRPPCGRGAVQVGGALPARGRGTGSPGRRRAVDQGHPHGRVRRRGRS